MTNTEEAVARALCEHCYPSRFADEIVTDGTPPFYLWMRFRDEARAAIAALPSRAEVLEEALRKLDDALCNYTNWVDDFAGITDANHKRVFATLCDAYNNWHIAIRALVTKENGNG